MILNLIKFVLVMDPDIHGVNKINKLFLSNYSLTFQLFLINLLASFIGFISLIIINIYLINNDRNISIDYDNGLNQINKITNFLGNNSILRVPLFNENCDNVNELTGNNLSSYFSKQSDKNNFQYKKHSLEIYGLCESCK